MNGSSIAGRVLPNLIADKYGPLNSVFSMAVYKIHPRSCSDLMHLAIIVLSFFTGVLVFVMFGATTVGGIAAFGIFYGFFSGGSKDRLCARHSLRAESSSPAISLATPGVSSFVTHSDASDLPYV